MSLFNRVAALAVLALVGAASGDRPAASGRVTSGPGAALRSARGVTDPFVLFGWVTPPASITTDARIAEMAGVGLNLTLPAWNDSGRREDNLVRLDFAAAHDMRCLIWDARFNLVHAYGPSSPEGRALIDSVVADYHAHPAFFGYYLGDEPAKPYWPYLEEALTELRLRDPDHPGWNNLSGRLAFPDRESWVSHHREYIEAMQPAVLCNDHYDFLVTGDRGQFVENAAGLAAIAREAGLPFWAIVQLVEHGPYRSPTPGELAWQASMLLAYGARGIGYFTYWTPAPDPTWEWGPAVISYEGERTAWYPVLAELNRRVRPAGETLAGLTWLATEHAGSTPVGGTPFAPDGLVRAVGGRAALGHFVDRSGVRHLLVANSDSLTWQRVSLTLNGRPHVWRLGEVVDDWRVVSAPSVAGRAHVKLNLGPGGFALLRIGGRFDPLGAGPGPTLGVSPRPAHREARLAVAGLGTGGHVEILDASGRRIRSWRPGTPEATFLWRGERDAGGFAPPGLYFVRAEDARGVAATRLEWLGSR
jgi:hypothetical protein